MKIRIIREMKLNKYHYKVCDEDKIEGFANYTYGLMLRKITVVSEKNVLMLKQTNWWMKAINSLPILNLELFAPFKLYINDTFCSKLKKVLFEPAFIFVIDDDSFELRLCNDNMISLAQNGSPIAWYKKEEYTYGENNIYDVDFLETSEISMSFLLLFCILIDVVFYNNTKISYMKYEKNYVRCK